MKQFLRFYGAPIVIVLLGLIVAFMFMAPAPPKKIVIAGGAAGGAYAATVESYAKALREQNIEVELLSTAGSVDNLAKIKAKQADIGIVQTGLAADFGSEGVRSLGAVFYEPLWVFHRAAAPMDELQDIAGRRVAIGPEGSGVRALATLLLREAGVTPDKYTASPLAGQEAAVALKAGEIDVALVVSGPTTDWIADLVGDGNIALLSMREAHALARRHGYLDEVALYRGVMDLAAILPKEDITLIAPAAQIVVRADLHPAIQSLLIEAAFREHAGGSLLADAGRFPTPELSDIAISDEAERYYKNGPSFLRRIFPYSVANFLERAWVLVIPLVTLIIPLVRAAPPLYRWRIRRKIYVWYNNLRELEAAGRAAETPEDRTEVRAKLADLQAETGKVEVPVSYTDDLYRLRAHIRFVAELVDKLSAQERHARI
ncbi:MAG: TAXI family TRAP transporter solute-binding subunit [Hyphomonadaceae bacterium]